MSAGHAWLARLAIITALLVLHGCAGMGTSPTGAGERAITAEHAASELRRGAARLIDTRSAGERSGREMPEALGAQYGADRWRSAVTPDERRAFLAALSAAGIDVDSPIITICNAGVRAGAAAMFLRTAGYTNVRYVSGGYLGRGADEGWEFHR